MDSIAVKSNRLLQIYSRLVAGDILNKKELAQQFHVAERSIQRDMESLRCFFLTKVCYKILFMIRELKVTLKPDLTKESFDIIKEEMRNSDKAQETYSYTTGKTFKETHRGSRFSQYKYYGLVSDSIKKRIDGIKNQAVDDLRKFVTKTTTAYSDELARNAKIKRDELNAIVQAKQTAQEIRATIKELEALLDQLRPMREHIKGLKGGIEKYV